MNLSLLSLVGVDTQPFSTHGVALQTCIIVGGLMVQGNLLGTFAEIVYEMNEVTLLAQQQADSLVGAMKQMDLNKETKNEALNYVKTVSMECYLQDQFSIF